MTQLPWGPVAGIPIKWSYANETARGAEATAEPEHIGSLAWQLDDDSLWLLTDDDPLTWVQVGGSGGSIVSQLETILTEPGDILIRRFSQGVSGDKPVTVSNAGTGDPSDITDSDPGPWTSASPGTGEWVKIDMEAPVELGYIRLIQEADGNHQANEYLLEYSLNNSTWQTASTRTGLPGDEDLVVFSEGPKVGRYWRLTCTDGAPNGWMIYEVVLGDPSQVVRLDHVGGRYLKSGAFAPEWGELDIRDANNVNDEDYNNGDIFYFNSGQWRKLAAGTNGDVLTLVSGLPAWVAP